MSPPSTGWFADWVYNKAAAIAPACGGTVYLRTTIDPHLQQLAANVVKATLAKYGSEKHASQAAMIAMRRWRGARHGRRTKLCRQPV